MAQVQHDRPQTDPLHPDPLHRAGAADLHWSCDNIGEGLPGILTPLGYTLWHRPVDHAGRESAYRAGVLSRRERAEPPEDRRMVQVFHGRAAMQAEFYARIGDRMPGTTGADVVRGVLGRVPDDFVFHPTPRRYPIIAWRLPTTFLRAPGQARALAAETERWWRATVPGLATLSLERALATFHDAHRRFGDNLVSQGVITFAVVSPLYQAVTTLVESTGVGDVSTLSGSGGAESAIIRDIWRASRGEIDLAEVVANHGFHGPGEGEISARVWREDSSPLAAMVNEYAGRPDSQDPVARDAEMQRRLPEVQRAVVAAVPAWQRPAVRALLSKAASGIPLRGVSKRAFLQSIDVARGAARRAGELLVAEGTLAEADDVFMLTVDELATPLPRDVRDLVAWRTERRAGYRKVTIPDMWTGTPEAVVDQDDGPPGNPEPAGDPSAGRAPVVVTGIGVSAGVTEGVVRIVTDPSFTDVEPDEVLVAPTTDPSWSSIMFISSALVVDIGGMLSHAAVVARELGIPCVVNTRTGSRELRTGDRVRVDGTTGTVTVIERTA